MPILNDRPPMGRARQPAISCLRNSRLPTKPLPDWVRKFNRVAAGLRYVVVDTAPNERALAASIAVSNLVLVPCTPSGLDLEATARTLEIIDMVRNPSASNSLNLILVPNRVDSRTLEGRQLVEELTGFNEIVSSTIGNRSAFVRAYSAGRSVADMPDATGGPSRDRIAL